MAERCVKIIAFKDCVQRDLRSLDSVEKLEKSSDIKICVVVSHDELLKQRSNLVNKNGCSFLSYYIMIENHTPYLIAENDLGESPGILVSKYLKGEIGKEYFSHHEISVAKNGKR